MHKLYKDGSIDKFTKYYSAIPIALSVAGIIFTFCRHFRSSFFSPDAILGHLIQDYPYIDYIIMISIALLAFFIMLFILTRPLFILSNNTLTYRNGLFDTHTYSINEIAHIRILSDEKSVSLDIKSVGGLTNTINMYATIQLDKPIKNFLEQYSHIEVKI